MATMFASAGDVFVPHFDQTAKLIVNYARDPKKYAVNQLMTVTPVDKPIGKFMRIKPEAQGRTSADFRNGRKWYDGSPRPIQVNTGQKHEWLEYFCQRNTVDFPLGYQTISNAVWDIVSTQSNALANLMMTDRAAEAYAVLQDSANYASGNTATATVSSGSGGKWDVSTSALRYIQKSLMYGVEKIVQATMNGVSADDLVLVVSPTVARQMAESGEVADYLAQNPDATRYIQGELFQKQLMQYGLPPRLYGINVVVDPLVVDSAALDTSDTTSKSFIAGATSAYLIARPGSIDSNAGGSSFSFLHCFSYKGEEMLVETVDDYINKRQILAVTDNRHIRSVASEAGFVFTEVVD